MIGSELHEGGIGNVNVAIAGVDMIPKLIVLKNAAQIDDRNGLGFANVGDQVPIWDRIWRRPMPGCQGQDNNRDFDPAFQKVIDETLRLHSVFGHVLLPMRAHPFSPARAYGFCLGERGLS
jgi:hypothetical protein